MKLTKKQLRKIIRESLEDESYFESMLKSGEISMIHQAITLAEDMGMGLLDLPWQSAPTPGATMSMGPGARQFDFDLAGIVIDQVESGLIEIPKGSLQKYKKLKENYEVMAKLKDKKLHSSDPKYMNRVFARTGLTNGALKLLKELTA